MFQAYIIDLFKLSLKIYQKISTDFRRQTISQTRKKLPQSCNSFIFSQWFYSSSRPFLAFERKQMKDTRTR